MKRGINSAGPCTKRLAEELPFVQVDSEPETFSRDDKVQIMKWISETKQRQPNVLLLHRAVEEGQILVIRWLLQNGNENERDVKKRDRYGNTPLHLAAEYGYSVIVKILLELPLAQRPDVNERNTLGYTPLHLAVKSGQVDLAKWLLNLPEEEAQPNVNPRAICGKTPLHLAVELGHFDIFKLFLNLDIDKRPDLFATDGNGQNLLHLSARFGQCNFVAFLTNLPEWLRFDPHQRDHQGNTTLHLAASYGWVHVVDFLLKLPQGQRPHLRARNAQNQTPIICAFEQKRDQVVQLLESYGACLPLRYSCCTLSRPFPILLIANEIAHEGALIDNFSRSLEYDLNVTQLLKEVGDLRLETDPTPGYYVSASVSPAGSPPVEDNDHHLKRSKNSKSDPRKIRK